MPGNSAATFADGMACRDPDPDAFAIIRMGAARIVTVSEDEIAAAIRALYADTHNVAEGAGAAALAALMKDGARMRGKRVALIMSGGNIDTDRFAASAGRRNAATITPSTALPVHLRRAHSCPRRRQ